MAKYTLLYHECVPIVTAYHSFSPQIKLQYCTSASTTVICIRVRLHFRSGLRSRVRRSERPEAVYPNPSLSLSSWNKLTWYCIE